MSNKKETPFRCAIEIVELFNYNMEYEPLEIATTFYGELMDGNHEFANLRHLKNFINKVFPEYSFVDIEKKNDGSYIALIADAESYDYYATEGMGWSYWDY